MKCPKEIIVEMSEDTLLKNMDGYDPDSYDEDSIDWLAVEIGNSMETVFVDSWEELDEMLSNEYHNYVLSDDGVDEAYQEWLEHRR